MPVAAACLPHSAHLEAKLLLRPPKIDGDSTLAPDHCWNLSPGRDLIQVLRTFYLATGTNLSLILWLLLLVTNCNKVLLNVIILPL